MLYFDLMQSNRKELDSVVIALRGFWSRCLLSVLLLGGMAATVAAQTATTTNLTIVSGGIEQSTVSSGTAVKLSASVRAGSAAVSPGQVEFCDASGAILYGYSPPGIGTIAPCGDGFIDIDSGNWKRTSIKPYLWGPGVMRRAVPALFRWM